MEVTKNKDIPVHEILKTNRQLFHKLEAKGIKTISAAMDYLLIYETYNEYDWVEKNSERKKIVASQCKVSLSTVVNAITIMSDVIKIKE